MDSSSSRVTDSVDDTSDRHTTFGFGLRTSLTDVGVLPNTFLRFDATKDLDGGEALIFGLQTSVRGISLTAERAQFSGFESERIGTGRDRLTSTTTFRGDGTIPRIGLLPDITFNVRASEDRHATGLIDTDFRLRLAASLNDVRMTNDIDWDMATC